MGFIYNESLTQLLQPSWQWWWALLIESTVALQPSRSLLLQLIQVIQMQQLTAPCKAGYVSQDCSPGLPVTLATTNGSVLDAYLDI